MKKILTLIIFTFITLHAQNSESNFSGVLSFDGNLAYSNTKNEVEDINNYNSQKKSALLAGAMSFVIPGAGEIYAKNYYMAAIFVAVEAAAITAGLIYDKKGDDQTAFYHEYAQLNWDVLRYAKWTINNLSQLNNELNATDYSGLIYDNGTKVNWTILNNLETEIGGWYSHRLPAFGEQQYYELIGKYPQFNAGWSDFGDEYTPYKYGDPLTEKFKYYAVERGKANDYYNIASKAVIIVIVNHVISAADAAWSVSKYNKNLKMNVGLQQTNLGFSTEYYPQLNLSYAF